MSCFEWGQLRPALRASIWMTLAAAAVGLSAAAPVQAQSRRLTIDLFDARYAVSRDGTIGRIVVDIPVSAVR